MGDTDPERKLSIGIGHLWSWATFMAAQLWAINFAKNVNYTNMLLIIMSPFVVQSAPLSLYDLRRYHDTFLWHHWYHWDNLSSPSSHLIEPCWHTVNSYIFGKSYGPKLSGHKCGPGSEMANSYGQFSLWVSVSHILKSEPSSTSHKPRASFQRWQVWWGIVHGKCPHAATQSYIILCIWHHESGSLPLYVIRN